MLTLAIAFRHAPFMPGILAPAPPPPLDILLFFVSYLSKRMHQLTSQNIYHICHLIRELLHIYAAKRSKIKIIISLKADTRRYILENCIL